MGFIRTIIAIACIRRKHIIIILNLSIMKGHRFVENSFNKASPTTLFFFNPFSIHYDDIISTLNKQSRSGKRVYSWDYFASKIVRYSRTIPVENARGTDATASFSSTPIVYHQTNPIVNKCGIGF